MKYLLINYLDEIEYNVTVEEKLDPEWHTLDPELKAKDKLTEKDYTDKVYTIAHHNDATWKETISIKDTECGMDYEILTPEIFNTNPVSCVMLHKLRVLLNFMHGHSEGWKTYGAYKAVAEADMKQLAE